MWDSFYLFPNRTPMDYAIVETIGSHLFLEHMAQQQSQDPNSSQSFPISHSTQFPPSPTLAPTIVKLTPLHPTTRPIEKEDITCWQSDPSQLVGKGFITTYLLVRRVFVVVDYAVKLVKGAQYDVVYEDTGLDEVLTLDPDTIFDIMVNENVELITNM